MSIFETLSKINVNEFTQKKNKLTYLPWAYAWGTLKSLYPESFYTVAENKDGWNYFTDGRTCWVKCAVTAINGEESNTAVEYLPVMDYKNNSISLEQVTSIQVNNTIQRCLTKAIARLGLGLYIYAGEDLPEELCADNRPLPPATPEDHTDKVIKPAPVITISDKVKPTEDPQPIQTQPAEIIPLQKSRTAIVHETCSRLSITIDQFRLCMKAANWGDVIPDAKINALSDDQFAALIDYVNKNYDLSA